MPHPVFGTNSLPFSSPPALFSRSVTLTPTHCLSILFRSFFLPIFNEIIHPISLSITLIKSSFILPEVLSMTLLINDVVAERASPIEPLPERLVRDLPTPQGWKAELTSVAGYIPRLCTCLQAVTHPSINRTWCRVTR